MTIKILKWLTIIFFLSPIAGNCQTGKQIEETFINMRKYVVSIGTIVTNSIKIENNLVKIKKFTSIGSGLMTYAKYDTLSINCIVTAGHVINFFRENNLDSIYVRPAWADTIKTTEYFGVSLPMQNSNKTPNTFLYPETHIDLGGIIMWPYYINKTFVDKAVLQGNKMFPLNSMTTPYIGSQVWICGYPGHIESQIQNRFLYNISTFKPGYVTWKPPTNIANTDLNHITLVESNASFGNSGGPVFALFKNVELVGILVGGYSEYDSIYLNNKPVMDISTNQPLIAKTRSGVSIIEKGEFVKKLIQYIESEIAKK